MTRINIEDIRLDGGTQSRVRLNDETIDKYAAHYADKVAMPPVVVYFDGTDRWLADGFHRVHAARAEGLARISAEIRQGSKRDAMLYSVGANAPHDIAGLARSNADKRRSVEVLLRDAEWGAKSDSWIAETCGVSQPFVGKLRPQLITVISCEAIEPAKTLGKDGKFRDTANIGKSRKPPAELKRAALAVARTETPASEPEAEPEYERNLDVALLDLDEDVSRHLKAWEWSEAQFVAALEAWVRRARGHFETKRKKASNG